MPVSRERVVPVYSRRRLFSMFSIAVLVFVILTMALPACFAQEADPPPEEEPAEPVVEETTVFDDLQAQLDEYLALMDEGKVDEALVVLASYLEDLKALSESGELSEEDAHAAHVLYMTSKHLAVLARVCEAHEEKGNGGGVLNALVTSTKGHGNVYRHMERELEQEAEGDAAEEGADPEEEAEGKGNGNNNRNENSNGKAKGKNK